MTDANPGGFFVAAYETERLKTLSVWSCFGDADLGFRPAPRARPPLEHMVHQCVSEDSWMKNMLAIEIALPALPAREDRLGFLHHYAEASGKRCEILATKAADWWDGKTRFFDVEESCRARARSHPRRGRETAGGRRPVRGDRKNLRLTYASDGPTFAACRRCLFPPRCSCLTYLETSPPG